MNKIWLQNSDLILWLYHYKGNRPVSQVDVNRWVVLPLQFAACGRKLTIKPGSRVNISSPDFSNHVEKGVQCQWEIDTNYTHVLQFHFLHIDLGEDSDPTANACSDSFISVTSEGNSHEKICRERSDFVGSSMEKVSYFSGIKNNNNTGFRILISTKGGTLYLFISLYKLNIV